MYKFHSRPKVHLNSRVENIRVRGNELLFCADLRSICADLNGVCSDLKGWGADLNAACADLRSVCADLKFLFCDQLDLIWQRLPLHPLHRYIFPSFFTEVIWIQSLTEIIQLQKKALIDPLQPATTLYKITWFRPARKTLRASAWKKDHES